MISSYREYMNTFRTGSESENFNQDITPSDVKDKKYENQSRLATDEEVDKEFYKKFKLPEERDPLLKFFDSVINFQTSFAKGVASGASLELSENINALKREYDDSQTGFELGQWVGVTAPVMGTSAILGRLGKLGLKVIPALGRLTFPNFMKSAAPYAKSALTGAAYSAEKSIAKAESPDPWEMMKEGGFFGGAHLATVKAFEKVPQVYNWLKTLDTDQLAEFLYAGQVPKNMPKNTYKYFYDEVVPVLQRIGQEEYEIAYNKAKQTAAQKYENELANIKAKHEKEWAEMLMEQTYNDFEFERFQMAHEDEVALLNEKYEFEKANIEKANQKAMKSFQQQNEAYELAKARDAAVENAFENLQEDIDTKELIGRVKEIDSEIAHRPKEVGVEEPVEIQVSNVITPNTIENPTTGGQVLKTVINESADVDNRYVNKLYDDAKKLNVGISDIHPELVRELEGMLNELQIIPDPSGPEKAKINTIKKILNRLVLYEGDVFVGYLPIENQVLFDQAKSIRYMVDYDFAQGSPMGIMRPVIRNLDNAALKASQNSGNVAAYNAHMEAKNAYRNWSELYDNDIVKPYRNTQNQQYTDLFKKAQNIDEYNVINQILEKTESGQKISQVLKKDIVNKHLEGFYKKPRGQMPKDIDQAVRDLRPILNKREEKSIHEILTNARKPLPFHGKQKAPIKPPKKPKLLPEPKEPKYPEYPKKKEVPEISEVKLPKRPAIKETKEIRAAAKMMKITPEEALKMTETATGLRNLKNKLSKTDAQKKMVKNIERMTIRTILQEGKIIKTPKGKDLFEVINKEENYSRLSEILGEEAVEDLLQASLKIANKQVTKESLKKFAKKTATFKAAAILGIL